MIKVNANTEDLYVELMGLQLTTNQAIELADRIKWAVDAVSKAMEKQYS